MKDFSVPTAKEVVFRLLSNFISILSFNKYSLRTAKKPCKYPDILETCSFAIDVGVAYGTPWIESIFARKPIFYVEGNPKFYDCISDNLLSCNDHLRRLFRCCAGNAHGQALLIDDNYASRVSTDSSYPHDALRKVSVERLDELPILEILAHSGCQTSNGLLKVDTEGFEYAVIQGSLGLLKNISVVVLELRLTDESPYNPHDLIDLLSEHGFRWHSVMDYGDFPGYISFIDLVLVKK